LSALIEKIEHFGFVLPKSEWMQLKVVDGCNLGAVAGLRNPIMRSTPCG
jgi:hypothetical protein